MNDLDYLNQISAGLQPQKRASFFDKKMKTVLVALAVAIVAVIVFVVIGSSAPKETTLDHELTRIYHRSDGITKLVSSYNKDSSSSSLRAAGNSLTTILDGLKSNITSTLKSSYSITASSTKPLESDSSLVSASDKKLKTAKQNGVLDRYYASELKYQVEGLIILETTALSKSPDSATEAYLKDSKSSLTRLAETFGNYTSSN